MEIEKTFNDIYDQKKWGEFEGEPSSGPGSSLIHARPFLDFLQNFINANGGISILDVGCGDFQYTRHLDLSGIKKYLGVDVVKSIIKVNKQKFGTDNVKFKYRDLTKHQFEYHDLYIVKDTLQHLNNHMVYSFLDYIVNEKLAKYIIICNCSNQEYDDQDLSEIGQTRPLNAKYYPLKKYSPFIVKEYSTKQISVIIVPSSLSL